MKRFVLVLMPNPTDVNTERFIDLVAVESENNFT
jgi:hypothetical protein